MAKIQIKRKIAALEFYFLKCRAIKKRNIAGDPIKCWVPQHFTGSHTKFTNAYCWVKNTYYLPFDEYIPDETTYIEEIEGEAELPYYQWLPFIMLGQVSLHVSICSICLEDLPVDRVLGHAPPLSHFLFHAILQSNKARFTKYGS